MLRLHPCPLPPSTPNPFAAFYSLMPDALSRGFARLFHSPTVYEDLTKTITLCNVNWKGTILMNSTLSTLIGDISPLYQLHLHTLSPAYNPTPHPPLHHSAISTVMGGADPRAELTSNGALQVRHEITLGVFPSPWEMAAVDDGRLRELCRVGYRSQRLIRLAHRFAYEGLDGVIEARLAVESPTCELYELLLSLEGFGPFAAANATALLGRYDAHPFDSETVRHMREHHGVDRQFKLPSAELLKRARAHYSVEKYGAAVFLVYWYELWCGYEKRAACRAEEWTQTQFSSFSNGGQQLIVADTAKPHALRVAEQTRKRKQGISGASPKRRTPTKAKTVRREGSEGSGGGEEGKEDASVGLQEESAVGEEVGTAVAAGKRGKITAMLKTVKRTVERKSRGKSMKVEEEEAKEVKEEVVVAVVTATEGRVTRTRARQLEAVLS